MYIGQIYDGYRTKGMIDFVLNGPDPRQAMQEQPEIEAADIWDAADAFRG